MIGLPPRGIMLVGALALLRPRANTFLYISQAILESGWFSRVVGENNYWGIKTYKGWTGRVVLVPTHEAFKEKKDADAFGELHSEYDDPPFWSKRVGAWLVKCDARFRDWDSALSAGQWYFGLLQRRYLGAYKATEPEGFVDGLYNGDGGRRWSTSPIEFYKDSIVKIYRRIEGGGMLEL
jgi:flagellum-specific peptidoglycan hydrolase FlgJ